MSRLLNEEHGGGALAERQWSSDQECIDSGGRSLEETSSTRSGMKMPLMMMVESLAYQRGWV